jgi:ABC-type sugar transport system ATPase subunit
MPHLVCDQLLYVPKVGQSLGPIHLTFSSPMFVVVVGDAAAGKSQLLRLISGQLSPTQGRVLFNSLETRRLNHDCPLVYTLGSWFKPHQSVSEALAWPLKVSGIPKTHREQLVRQIAQKFNLVSYLHQRVDTLSESCRAMLSIAQGLHSQTQLILCDNSLSGCSAATQAKLLQDLRDCSRYGLVVYATNKAQDVLQWSDYAVCLDAGQILDVVPTTEIQYARLSLKTALMLMPELCVISCPSQSYENGALIWLGEGPAIYVQGLPVGLLSNILIGVSPAAVSFTESAGRIPATVQVLKTHGAGPESEMVLSLGGQTMRKLWKHGGLPAVGESITIYISLEDCQFYDSSGHNLFNNNTGWTGTINFKSHVA